MKCNIPPLEVHYLYFVRVCVSYLSTLYIHVLLSLKHTEYSLKYLCHIMDFKWNNIFKQSSSDE
jgi:hypothetical protein